MRRKLIVVSNRGPVTIDRNGAVRRSSGGLATALRSLLHLHDVTWIASAISDGDRLRAGKTWRQDEYGLHFVAHDPQVYDWYYNVVANPMLWFIQHSLWELAYTPKVDAAFHRAWHDGYAAVNAGFAAAVLSELDREPEAAVFFHDYHLYLAPRLVREQRPNVPLMHFVHVPWPQPDYWRVLPRAVRCAIHEGLIANDVIGFHTERWRSNFVYSTRELLGEDVTPKTVTAPISVDTAEFAELAESETVLEAERDIVARRPEKLVVRDEMETEAFLLQCLAGALPIALAHRARDPGDVVVLQQASQGGRETAAAPMGGAVPREGDGTTVGDDDQLAAHCANVSATPLLKRRRPPLPRCRCRAAG